MKRPTDYLEFAKWCEELQASGESFEDLEDYAEPIWREAFLKLAKVHEKTMPGMLNTTNWRARGHVDGAFLFAVQKVVGDDDEQ